MNWWIDVTNKIFHKTHFLSNLDYDILIFQASTSRAGKSINDEAVFIKKFPRYEDVFCLGVEERSRSLKMDNALPVNMTDTIGGNNLENFQRSEFGLMILKISLCWIFLQIYLYFIAFSSLNTQFYESWISISPI